MEGMHFFEKKEGGVDGRRGDVGGGTERENCDPSGEY